MTITIDSQKRGVQRFYRSCLWVLLCAAPVFSMASVEPTESEDTSTIINEADLRQGSLVLHSTAWQGKKLSPLVHTDVDMSVTGMVARTKVTQAFYNPSQDWVNGVYVFPLPENAAVDTLKLIIGERIIEGQIQPKKKAKAIYEQAKREGKKASLLSQNRPNLFTTSVANIGPGEAVVVSMEYQHRVEYKQGRFALRFPMTVLPRYIPGTPLNLQLSPTGWALNTSEVTDASDITPLIKHADAEENKVSLHVRINSGMPLDKIESESHVIESSKQGMGHYHVTLDTDAVANHDFVLHWYPQASVKPQAAIFSQPLAEQSYGLLMVLPPTAEAAPTSGTREVIFVLDTSGSMAGDSIVQAKSALQMALRDLDSGDTFNIIEFNSYTRALWPQPRHAEQDSIAAANSFVQRLRADGGTEMASALTAALTTELGTESEARLRQVIFITDGSVGNEEALMALIDANLGDSRLFTVGIGSAPNSYFMTEAALQGRGTFTYIGAVNQVQAKMATLLTSLRHPALTDIHVKFSGEVEFYPSIPPDLYSEEPLILSYRHRRGGEEARPQDVGLSGRMGSEDWSVSLSLNQAGPQTGLDKLWAREKISQLTRDRRKAADPAPYNTQIETLSLAHHLVSEFTSLVAVDVTPSRPSDQLAKDKSVPVHLAKGSQSEKIFGSLPQGSTPLKQYLLLAMLSLALLGLYYLLPRRVWSGMLWSRRTERSTWVA